jgi:hypothetical protein
MQICTICDKPSDETCSDGACRKCHVSVSWEDCTSGIYAAEASRRLGYSAEALAKMYPQAELSRRVDL